LSWDQVKRRARSTTQYTVTATRSLDPTIGRSGSGHYRLRPFPFHPDVSRSPRAKLSVRSTFFVPGSDRLPILDTFRTFCLQPEAQVALGKLKQLSLAS